MIPNLPPELPEYLQKLQSTVGLTSLDLEDLQREGLCFWQLEDGFRFGSEQILLSHFAADLLGVAKIKELENVQTDFWVLDPGAGTGILTVLASALIPNSKGLAIEVMPRPFAVLQANLEMNNLEHRFSALQADILNLLPKQRINATWNYASFDLAICNPPYFKKNSGANREMSSPGKKEIAIAREELLINLEQYINFVSKALKQNGIMAILNRPERLTDTIIMAKKYHLEPYYLRAIKNRAGSRVSAFLLACKKHRPCGFRWGDDLIIYNDDGSYTDEVGAYYE